MKNKIQQNILYGTHAVFIYFVFVLPCMLVCIVYGKPIHPSIAGATNGIKKETGLSYAQKPHKARTAGMCWLRTTSPNNICL